MTPEQELLDTIEEIRAKRYADVPADLVKQIVQIERDFTDNRQEAHKRIAQAVDADLGGLATGGKE
jgi:hypothetical protein